MSTIAAALAERSAGATSEEIQAGCARHLARMAHAHRGLYGTDDPASLPPMARAQTEAIRRDWADPAKLPRLIAIDRLSR
jgi:hypothetical protein